MILLAMWYLHLVGGNSIFHCRLSKSNHSVPFQSHHGLPATNLRAIKPKKEVGGLTINQSLPDTGKFLT
jgi:hypothetical protein